MVSIDSKGDLKLCTLPPESLCEAAELAAAAFHDSPIYVAICGDAKTTSSATTDDEDDGADHHPHSLLRRRFLRWLFERNFRLRLGTSANRAIFDDHGKLLAFFMFVAPDIADVGLWDMLRVGMLMAPFKFGIGVVKRLLSIKDDYELFEREVMDAHGNEPMFRLERMVVHPDVQGKGLGSRALKQALGEADAARLPVLLSTQEERNVRFYGRLGFEVVRTHALFGCAHWTMLRRPVQPC